MASKTSDASLRSFVAPSSALEQAQAILRQADVLAAADGKAEGQAGEEAPPLSLAQMLAAYGEALAMERKASNISSATGASASTAPHAQVRRQSSLASVSERPLARVSEHAAPPPSAPAAIAIGGKVRSPPPAALALSRSGANSSASTPPASPARFAKSSAGTEARVPSMPMLPAAAMGEGKRTASNEEKERDARKAASGGRFDGELFRLASITVVFLLTSRKYRR